MTNPVVLRKTIFYSFVVLLHRLVPLKKGANIVLFNPGVADIEDEMLSGSSYTICLKWDEFDGIAGDKYGLEH
jgi:hypothetical protein